MISRVIGARSYLAALAVLVASVCAALGGSARVAAQDVGTEAQRESGKPLYLKYCSQCHGENGNGEGYATPHLRPRPRDFTTGKFKIRTTPNGALPTHQDLVSIIRRGMPYTSMPAWPNLTDDEVSNLAYFITTFSPDFSKAENAAKPVPLPSAPRATNESIELGKKLYVETGCVKCHGTLGRGDGASAPTLKDDWGYPLPPANLAQSWTFRGGSSREDIFRTMTTGLNGTPMPGFLDDALAPEQRWAITDFIVSLSGTNGPGYTNLVIAKHVPEKIDLAKGAASFASAPVARFPIVGQIMEPGRAFHPPTTGVTVQAIYDADSIAMLVRWHDMSAQKTGKNGPSLPVPLEEEEAPAIGAGEGAGAGAKGGVFGDAEVATTPAGQAQDPFAEADCARRPAIRILRRGRGADSVADAGGGPQALLHLRRSRELRGSLVLRSGKRQSRSVHRQGQRGYHAQGHGDLTGVASYDQGEWSVIFKRPLRPASAAPFSPGTFMPVGFSVWDGYSRERGNRRGLTLWYSLYVEPETVPSAVGPMVRTALIILAIELALIGWVRWNHGSRDYGKLGGEPRHPAATRG